MQKLRPGERLSCVIFPNVYFTPIKPSFTIEKQLNKTIISATAITAITAIFPAFFPLNSLVSDELVLNFISAIIFAFLLSGLCYIHRITQGY